MNILVVLKKCVPLAHRAAAHCARRRELFTPRLRARNQTNYRRIGNVKKHFGEKSQRLSRVRVAPQYGFLCVMDL